MNYYGAIFAVVVTEPTSLALLEPPGKFGADIVVGEGQALGNPIAYGGPYLGFMACKKELIRKLSGLKDPQTGEVAITEMFDSEQIYNGPYVNNGPDLISGYNVGYRISWDGATGIINGVLFEDNTKPWSGDHCIDPRLVPGVIFCNRKITSKKPALMDIAPTVLNLFGVEPPGYMEGAQILDEEVHGGIDELSTQEVPEENSER